ncbi:uracil-DNA glycosylase [Alsobacter sp. R-9]
MTQPDLHHAAAQLLRWYADMGVDVAIDESPHDRMVANPAAPEGRGASAPQPAPPASRGQAAATVASAAPPAPSDAAQSARLLARSAKTLEELRGLLDTFEGCALRKTAKSLVFADGNPAGRVMLVGEAPGAEEDRSGLPFVGRSGQLLDRMLAAIGLDRGSVYIANVIPWRPPGNRTPTPQEAAVCQPFIERQVQLADPDILVCLGGPSAQALLGVKDGILKARGRWTTYDTGTRSIRAIATLHPAYLLRQPLQKRLAWRDFKAIRAALEEGNRTPG